MLEQPGGSPQDEDETETAEGSPDPTVLLAAAMGRFEEHPLFPRADGTPEIREIKFVSFCRKRSGDQALQNCPEDIPAREVKSWGQVVEWWGGGEYKAIAKDAKHRMVAWYPNGNGDWMMFDGESKPFVLRSGKGYSAPGRAAAPTYANAAPAAPAPAPAPTSNDALMGMMAQVLQEIRNARVAAPPPPAADSALVAMIQAQATQSTATTQANAQMMQTLLSVVAQRPAESAVRPAEPTTLALQLIGAVQKLVPAPAPAPAPGLAEQIPLIKALRDLYQPAAPAAPANELQPFVDIFGQVMAADAARTQAERAQSVSKPQETPAPRPAPRLRPALVHVPGIGMVEVVAPDAGALRFGEMSTEERAAAIRKDPALLRELGIGLPPAPIAPVAAIAPVAVVAQAQVAATPPPVLVTPVVESVVVIPAVPDLEPTPVLMVPATPTVSSPSESAMPPVVASAPPVEAFAPPLPATAAVASQEPPAPSLEATVVGEPANAPEERAAIALPERMPDPEPVRAAAPDGELAFGELQRLTSLSHEERAAALRKLPGIGPIADQFAHALDSLPSDALRAMAQALDLNTLSALAEAANGVAGR